MSAISGKKTVTAAGTAVALGSGQVHGPLMVKALVANTGYIYIGNDGAGDVASTNGLELAAGDVCIFNSVSNLSSLMVDSSVNGEGVSYIFLNP
jgi:hypothetical protein